MLLRTYNMLRSILGPSSPASVIAIDPDQELLRKKLEHARRTVHTVSFGGYMLPITELAVNTAFLGHPGSGKTTLIRVLIKTGLLTQTGFDPPVYGPLRDRGLIIDQKQELLACAAALGLSDEQLINLNPFDARGWAWRISLDVDSPAAAQHVASAIVPVEQNSTNVFFSNAARELVEAAMLALHELAPGKWTLADICNCLSCKEYAQHVLNRCEQTWVTAHNYLNQASDRAAGDILATVRTRLSALSLAAALSEHTPQDRQFSIKQWLQQEDPSLIILGVSQSLRAAAEVFNSAFFRVFSDELLSLPEDPELRGPIPRTWVVADELAEAGRLDGLIQLLTRGRSKGVRCVLGMQCVSALKDKFGDQGGLAILSMIDNFGMLRVSPETAKYAADVIGQIERRDVTVSENHTRSDGGGPGGRNWSDSFQQGFSEQVRLSHPVLPSQFQHLPPTNPRNGLNGYFLTPRLGWWRAHLDWDHTIHTLAAPRRPEHVDYPAFIPRPTSQQYIRPWGPKRMSELRLPALPLLGSSSSAMPSPPINVQTLPKPSPALRIGSDDFVTSDPEPESPESTDSSQHPKSSRNLDDFD